MRGLTFLAVFGLFCGIAAAIPGAVQGNCMSGYTILTGVGVCLDPTHKHILNISDVTTCCGICSGSSMCTGWTWHTSGNQKHQCWTTEAKVQQQKPTAGTTSGIIVAPTPAPIPTPPPTPEPMPTPHAPTPVPPPTPHLSKPHILYVLADDFGWADADWHRPANWTELATPNMMWLISQGAELDQHYAFKFCSPTRSAIQSGRNPIHVNVQNYQPVQWNWQEPDKDPDSGFAGISRNMTTISSVMKGAGYATHFAGKWDCRMTVVHCALCTHCALTVHSLYTHCTLTVHSLYTHCALTVHSLYTHCALTVHLLYTHCTLTVHSLCTHCALTVHSLYIHCTLTIHSLCTYH
jgi:hypothetical protein